MSLPIPVSIPDLGSLSELHLAAGISSEAVEYVLSTMQRSMGSTSVGRDALVECVNAKPKDDHAFNGGYTALHYACQTGLPKAVELLLEAGANPNAKKNNGATPLICSISSAGWNPRGKRNSENETSRPAAEKHVEIQKECMKLLLNHPKFDMALNDQDGDGRCSPAWLCVGQDYQYEDILTDVLDMLLARGFNANGTINNRSALHEALLCGHQQCALKLVKAGADIYVKATVPGNENVNPEPWTALEACRSWYGMEFANRMEEAARCSRCWQEKSAQDSTRKRELFVVVKQCQEVGPKIHQDS